MPKNGRILWRFADKQKDGRRATTSDRPPKSRVAKGEPRCYGDFRDFSDVGGGIEALVPEGGTRATSDPELAEKLASDRADELREKRLRGAHGVPDKVRLGPYASHYLEAKAEAGKVRDRWLQCVERHLEIAVEFFGENTELLQIGVSDLQTYLSHLRDLPNGQGGTYSEATCRKYLNSLSNMFEWAQAEEVVEPGFNPVSSMPDKPTAEEHEANWLEVPDAALLLEAARLHEPGKGAIPFAHELLATFLLTGGRKSEVLGLDVQDLDFDRRTVAFRPNEHRTLKTSTSRRVVPMPDQLHGILEPYVRGAEPKIAGLLFPSPVTGERIKKVRYLLDQLLERIDGLEPGDVRLHDLRHTYCAASLQLLDRGAPISKWTVASRMGHGGTRLIDKIYGHLGEVRHRSEELEFRVDQHEERLGDRLHNLRRAS